MKRTSSGGLPRPHGYVAPPLPHMDDVVRTIRVACTDIASYAWRLATIRDLESTSTAAGLSLIRSKYEKTLRRLRIDLHVFRAENVPTEGGLLFFWNQESHLDHLVLPCAIPRPFVSLFNNALARIPYYGAHMARTGHLHVDRTNETQWRESVRRAAARAREGTCILVSPEGTRSWDGQLLPLKRGGFILASQSECPIVCVTVIGGHERMPRGSPFVRQGSMHVVFSDPIDTRGQTEARLMEVVASTFRGAKAQFSV